MSHLQRSSNTRRKKKSSKQRSKPNSRPKPVMQIGSPAFQKLEAQWYQKLAQQGFNDIEINPDILNNYDGLYFKSKYTPKSFEEKKKYFERATDLENEGIFLDETEQMIWHLHSKGISIRAIVEALKKKGISRHKDQVNQIINELQDMMARV